MGALLTRIPSYTTAVVRGVAVHCFQQVGSSFSLAACTEGPHADLGRGVGAPVGFDGIHLEILIFACCLQGCTQISAWERPEVLVLFRVRPAGLHAVLGMAVGRGVAGAL